jgi:hypothetical protein
MNEEEQREYESTVLMMMEDLKCDRATAEQAASVGLGHTSGDTYVDDGDGKLRPGTTQS